MNLKSSRRTFMKISMQREQRASLGASFGKGLGAPNNQPSKIESGLGYIQPGLLGHLS
jgi:hypothetical protein